MDSPKLLLSGGIQPLPRNPPAPGLPRFSAPALGSPGPPPTRLHTPTPRGAGLQHPHLGLRVAPTSPPPPLMPSLLFLGPCDPAPPAPSRICTWVRAAASAPRTPRTPAPLGCPQPPPPGPRPRTWAPPARPASPGPRARAGHVRRGGPGVCRNAATRGRKFLRAPAADPGRAGAQRKEGPRGGGAGAPLGRAALSTLVLASAASFCLSRAQPPPGERQGGRKEGTPGAEPAAGEGSPRRPS